MAGFRVYLPDGAPNEGVAALPRTEAHHLIRVLRAREGDAVTLFDGKGNRWEAALANIEGKQASVAIHAHKLAAKPARALVLAMAMVKVKAFDEIVRHATEIGATAITPIITARNEVKLDPARAAAKHEHWQAIAVEACKQSGNPWLPEIAAPMSFANYLKGAAIESSPTGTARFVASLEDDSEPLVRALAKCEGETCEVAIGPEGDFTADEYAQLRDAGYAPVRLGPHVLRAETSALYALSIMAHC